MRCRCLFAILVLAFFSACGSDGDDSGDRHVVEPDTAAEGNGDSDSDGDNDGDGDADSDSDGDGDGDADADSDGDGDSDGDSDGDTGGDGDGDGDADADSDGDGDTGGDGDGDGDGGGDGDSDGDTDGDADADADGDSDDESSTDTEDGDTDDTRDTNPVVTCPEESVRYTTASGKVFCCNDAYPTFCDENEEGYTGGCWDEGVGCETLILCDGDWRACGEGATPFCDENGDMFCYPPCEEPSIGYVTRSGRQICCPPDKPSFCDENDAGYIGGCWNAVVDCGTIIECDGSFGACATGQTSSCEDGAVRCGS